MCSFFKNIAKNIGLLGMFTLSGFVTNANAQFYPQQNPSSIVPPWAYAKFDPYTAIVTFSCIRNPNGYDRYRQMYYDQKTNTFSPLPTINPMDTNPANPCYGAEFYPQVNKMIAYYVEYLGVLYTASFSLIGPGRFVLTGATPTGWEKICPNLTVVIYNANCPTQ